MNQIETFSNRIKNLSNKILFKEKDKLIIICNDWLYYKRLHPVELEKYELIKIPFLVMLNKHGILPTWNTPDKFRYEVL